MVAKLNTKDLFVAIPTTLKTVNFSITGKAYLATWKLLVTAGGLTQKETLIYQTVFSMESHKSNSNRAQETFTSLDEIYRIFFTGMRLFIRLTAERR